MRAGRVVRPGNAQLPAPPMLMMDRITDISEDRGEHGKGHVVAEFDITPDLWFFDCHFPGNPIMPAAWASTASGNSPASTSAGAAGRDAVMRSAWARSS